MSLLKSKIRVGITLGDPAGIGSEVIVKAVNALSGLAKFVLIGDKYVYDQVIGLSGYRDISRAQSGKVSSIKFINLNNVTHKNFRFGKVSAQYGRASIEYLDKAVEMLKSREIDCLVTAPISKEAINLAGFHYTGHTEYFSRKSKVKDIAMMLLNQEIKFSLVTRHIPLKDVAKNLNLDNISKTIKLSYQALKNIFALTQPRIVVCGLNPHGSDNGLIGDEEIRIIRPVVSALKKKFKGLSGPLPADVAIAKAVRKEYDCVVALYHDQALIALKLLGDDSGVNVTLGLPFIRTSPLHGTAFDIAGKNQANPASLIASIKLAVQCRLNQKKD